MVLNLDYRQYCAMTRRVKNLKLKQIAGYINCSISMISQWERNIKNLSDDKIKLYLEFLEDYNEK